MPAQIRKLTRRLTWRYLFAISIVAILTVANSWLLRAQMRASEASVELLTLSGRQRTVLQSTALLAQALVSVYSPDERKPLRDELVEAIESLEHAHHRLVEFNPSGAGHETPAAVREIYDSTPWLLDTEIRNYLTHLRELAKAESDELSFLNPHYRYVREVTLRGQVMQGLEEVVREYRSLNESLSERLRSLVWYAMSSTLAVLAMTGLFVFQPMVRQVQQDLVVLDGLNATLEARVSERTLVAETKARELARSESRYHSLVESLPVGVARLDSQQRFTYANRPFCEMVGFERQRVLGNTFGDVFSQYRPGHDDDRMLAELGNAQPSVQRLLRDSDADDSRQILELIHSWVEDAATSEDGVQVIVWDITQRQADEERALRAERLAAIGEMIAGVAHESRNALQQINACAKLMEWEAAADENTLSLIADIQQAHDRLHRLFENLRGYASPIRIDPRPVLMADIFREAWSLVMRNASDRDVRLSVTGDAEQTKCMVDPYQWEQVFCNVLENALAVCDDPVKIDVRWDCGDASGQTRLVVAVADNGPGMTEDVKKRIFEPFFTTRTKGTGLGMAIVQRIVAAHGGAIEVISPLRAGGTEVRISIPRDYHE